MMERFSDAVIHQSYMFVYAVGWGMLLGLTYDGIQVIRAVIRHNKWIVVIEDILFWLVWACVIYGLLYTYDYGLVRSYTIVGMFTGICLFTWIHRKFKKIVNSFLKVLKKRLKPVKIKQVNMEDKKAGGKDGKK